MPHESTTAISLMYAGTPYIGMATAYSPAGWRRTAKSFRRFGGGEIFLWRNF
jgi:hypothetical protein